MPPPTVAPPEDRAPSPAARSEAARRPGSPFDGRHLLAQAAVVVATAAWWAIQVPAISAPATPSTTAPRPEAAPHPPAPMSPSMPTSSADPAALRAPAASMPGPAARHAAPVHHVRPSPRRHQIAHAVAVARRHAPPHVQVGQASFYSRRLAGRPMASGRPFDPGQPVAASRTLPIGTTAKVTNLETGRSATVRIEDRGPVPRDRVVDVAPAVARQIGIDHRDGLAPVAVEPLSMPASSPGRPPRQDDGTPAPSR